MKPKDCPIFSGRAKGPWRSLIRGIFDGIHDVRVGIPGFLGRFEVRDGIDM